MTDDDLFPDATQPAPAMEIARRKLAAALAAAERADTDETGDLGRAVNAAQHEVERLERKALGHG